MAKISIKDGIDDLRLNNLYKFGLKAEYFMEKFFISHLIYFKTAFFFNNVEPMPSKCLTVYADRISLFM